MALCDIDFERCQSVANEFAEEFGVESTLALHCDVTDQEIFESECFLINIINTAYLMRFFILVVQTDLVGLLIVIN